MKVGKAPAQKPRAAAPAARERAVRFTQSELIATRELLEGVMTLASHGILFRVGQLLGESVVAEARASGGPLNEAAGRALVARQFASQVRFFAQKVQVEGSIEVKASPESSCHLMRGILQRVLSADGVAFMVREESCASQGGESCMFAVTRGGRAP